MMGRQAEQQRSRGGGQNAGEEQGARDKGLVERNREKENQKSFLIFWPPNSSSKSGSFEGVRPMFLKACILWNAKDVNKTSTKPLMY